VQDKGVGVNQSEVTEIFNLWGKRHRSAHNHSDGVGLGLYSSKVILSHLGSDIKCFSQGSRKGATFAFKFPVARSKSEYLGRDQTSSDELMESTPSEESSYEQIDIQSKKREGNGSGTAGHEARRPTNIVNMSIEIN